MSDQFETLKKRLQELEWPSVYYFKFICPSDEETVAKVTALFGGDTDLNLRPSKKGNYMSVSAKEVMINAQAVINIYEKSAQIKGVISL